MKSIYVIAAAIVVLVIIIGSVFAYTALQSPGASPSPAPTSTPTVAQTSTPTVAPTSTAIVAPTATPTVSPTLTPTPTATPGPATLNAQGATFPLLFINAVISNYTSLIRPNLTVNYQGTSSGGGITALTSKTVDFACSDSALTASQTAALPSQAVTIPETVGAITLAYNLPGISTGLNLTGPVIANIYMGTITRWNDPQIQSLNPGTTLPNQPIGVVYRSGNSGTTKWFTQYLSNVSPTWNNTLYYGQSVQWPVGTGASGNAGVATAVNTTQYAIGYVELAYSLQNGLTIAAVQNPSQNYILPSLASTTSAAASIPTSGLPIGTGDWTNVNILNAPGAQSYPICNPTYMLVYKELNTIPGMDVNKATQLVQFLWYVVHGGQNLSPLLSFATLPSNIVTLDETTIRSITFNGQVLPVS